MDTLHRGNHFVAEPSLRMDIDPDSIDRPLNSLHDVERRHKPRIYYPFPAMVSGIDGSGKTFEIETTIDNMCAGGLYLRLTPNVQVGTKLSIIVRLSSTTVSAKAAPQVEIDGVVLRSEERQNGRTGVGIGFERHRFL